MDRTCPKCNRTFDYPSRLKAHLARKVPCVSEAPQAGSRYVCEDCNRSFKEKRSLTRHQKGRCEAAKAPDPPQTDPAPQAPQIKVEPHITVNVHGDHNDTNVVVNVHADLSGLNPFHQTDTKFITAEDVLEAAAKSAGSFEALISHLMKKLYTHPENRNAYLDEWQHEPIAKILEKEAEGEPKWVSTPIEVVHPTMVGRASKVYNKKWRSAKSLQECDDDLGEEISSLLDDMIAECPKWGGPSQALLRKTKMMAMLLLEDNRTHLKEEGLI